MYIEVRNTSDRDHFDIEAPIIAAIERGGYRIIDDPEHAHYWLQANVLMVEKSTKDDAQQSLLNGYEGPWVGRWPARRLEPPRGSGETVALAALVREPPSD
ncbi:MAG: complement resistance protein TraT [Nitrospirales bacterium]